MLCKATIQVLDLRSMSKLVYEKRFIVTNIINIFNYFIFYQPKSQQKFQFLWYYLTNVN